ncbi:MAG: transketolase [Phycisphaerae bacterium]|nr:transketolase [Phycisphaerae bacterium]
MDLKTLVHDRAIEIGKLSARMTTKAESGHPSSALSLAHIVSLLMYKHMRYDPKDPWNPASDRLVLSEGHAVPIVYAAYADLAGVVGKSKSAARELVIGDVDTLREIDSVLDGHPNPAEGFPFFDAATGSLGQGLSAGAGLALAARLAKLDKKIYVICGDGESREGQIWEAADFIVDQKITNLCAIVNCNGQGQADYVSPQQSQSTLAAKFKAFGWQVATVDGHNVEQLDEALAEVGKTKTPYVILAATVKGWGTDELKDKSNHGKPLPEDKLEKVYGDLDAMRAKLGVPAEVKSEQFRPAKPQAAQPQFKGATGKLGDPDFDQLLQGDGFLKSWQAKKKIASRRAYGLALRELAKLDDRVVAIDGDVSNSTFANYLTKVFPDRFFEGKIAEQNLISVAAGMAAGGAIPFASSFGKFLVRAYDQIEMALITRANIKIAGSHIGISLAADGPSQMGLVDMTFFRSLSSAKENGKPLAVIFNPSDAVSAYKMVQMAADYPGMVYIRTMRPDTVLLYKPAETFEIGGAKVLDEGSDLTIVATGYMVHVARAALGKLKEQGVKAGLVDAYSFPLQSEPILAAAKASGGKILTLEDNYIGGLASNVAEIAAAVGNIKVKSMFVERVPKSGKSPEDLLAYCGLSVEDVVREAKAAAK